MDECRPWQEDDTDLASVIFHKLVAGRIPTTCYIALTHRCSLRCRHCYLGDQQEIRRHADKELSFGDLVSILDQLREAGTLYLVFTGGEVMLRPDFGRIYEYAIRQGFLVTILSNGTLIDRDIIKLFRKYPPRTVEISMYGATAETYEQVTQVKGSHTRFAQGIQLLAENKIRFMLKSMIMTINHHELDAMEAIADGYGVRYNHDAALFPCVAHPDNGGRSNCGDSAGPDCTCGGLDDPLRLRIDPEQAVELDFGTEKRRQKWAKSWRHEKDKKIPDCLFTCFATVTSGYINPYGILQPCVLNPYPNVDLRNVPFLEGWNGALATLKQQKAPENYPCNDCRAKPICSACPAQFRLEHGRPDIISEYMCRIAHKRLEKIQNFTNNN